MKMQIPRNRLNLPPPPIPALEGKWALFLDVDGTLLDLASRPDAVVVPEGLVDLLEHLHTLLDGALALISGRRIETLDALFAPLRLPCAGLHGFEYRDSLGIESHEWIDESALEKIRSAARKIATDMPAMLVEDKNYSIAFHYRHAKIQQAKLRDCLEAIATDTGFVIQPGIDVYELKPPGIDKGSALTRLMRDEPFAQRMPIYIGDDLTDEYALISAQHFSGMGIHVGSMMPSAAHFGLPAPAAVLRWLQQWKEQLI